MKNKIVYSLNTEDIQLVATQEIGRELTDSEIEKIQDLIGEKINWYEAILGAIVDKIDSNKNS